MAVPRLIRNAVTRQKIINTSGSSSSSSSNIRSRYSPRYILSKLFIDQLTVKRSLKQHGRFFMYEESQQQQQHDVMPNIITVSPNELSALLQQQSTTNNRDHNDTETSSSSSTTTTAAAAAAAYHYYWTAPIKSVAPASLLDEFQWYKQLYSNNDNDDVDELLDPRGPSLWMGTSGCGTQCEFPFCIRFCKAFY